MKEIGLAFLGFNTGLGLQSAGPSCHVVQKAARSSGLWESDTA
jgi:hypothetical protein